LDAIFRYRLARQWPGFADKDAVKSAVNASPKLRADTDYTTERCIEACKDKGLIPPHV
jgi:hypothetical protein